MSTSSADVVLASVFRIVNTAEHLGSRTTATGARLIGHAPHVAAEADLHAIFPPLSDAEIAALEDEVRCPLPSVYRALLRVANGLSLFSGSLSVYGRRTSYARSGDAARQPFSAVTPNTVERPRHLPVDAVVVGGYRRDGSLLYVRRGGGTIRCDREATSPLNQWPDLWAMPGQEVQRLASYFDESGRLRDGGRGSAPPPERGAASTAPAI
jgi:hypothetical protein